MRRGDIFIVHDTPSNNNDIIGLLDKDTEYPVIGIVVDVYDDGQDDSNIETEVYSQEGVRLSPSWFFMEDELEVIEDVREFLDNRPRPAQRLEEIRIDPIDLRWAVPAPAPRQG